MARRAVDPQGLVCSQCLDLLQTPVTLPCGDSYCHKCIQQHWDTEETPYTCPQCGESFKSWPVLCLNFLLAKLAQKMKDSGLTAAPGALCAGPLDVSCDVCTGVKLKALHSCLQCVASYCERHLQSHYDVAAFHKHQLVAPLHTLQENLCSEHNELRKIFCDTDKQLICVLCSQDQHRGHFTFTCAAERARRQPQLPKQRDLLLQNLQHKDTELSALDQLAQNIRDEAHAALTLGKHTLKLGPVAILMDVRDKEIGMIIRSIEERGLSQVRELKDQVKQEVSELKKRIRDLDTMSIIKDHTTFLQLHLSLVSQEPVPLRIHTEGPVPAGGRTEGPVPAGGRTEGPVPAGGRTEGPVPARGHREGPVPARGHREGPVPARGHREGPVPAGGRREVLLSGVEKLCEEMSECMAAIMTPLQVFELEPKTRDELLRYATDFTVDTDTAHPRLCVFDGDRAAKNHLPLEYSDDNEDRFRGCFAKALSRESVNGRCYFEVEWGGEHAEIAVAYRDTPRKDEGMYGGDDKSWGLTCSRRVPFIFCHNKVSTKVFGRVGSRIGVFLDHRAGLLSFYHVFSKCTKLILRVQTTFSQPLHAAVGFFHSGVTTRFLKLK